MLNTYDLAPLCSEDREQVMQFAAFLAAVGRAPGDPARTKGDVARLKEWLEAEPDERCAYLGLTRERARELGFDV